MLLWGPKDLPLFYPLFQGKEKLDQKEEDGELIYTNWGTKYLRPEIMPDDGVQR